MHVKALLSFSFSFLLTWTRLGVHRAHSAVRENPVVFLYLFCAPSCPHPSVFFSTCSLLGLFFIIIISSSLHAFLHFVPRTHFALILFPLQPFVDSELSFFFLFFSSPSSLPPSLLYMSSPLLSAPTAALFKNTPTEMYCI